MSNGNIDNIVLALLFSSDEPLSVRKMSSILDDTPGAEIKEAIVRWRKRLDDDAWSVVLEKVAGGYQLSSRPEYAPYIARLYTGRRKLRLSKAALEALAIIAYRQPITRADIENVRGVACGGVVSNLLERSLIRITGKAKVLGAPFLYGTTQEFLEYLGLNSLKDLPSLEELEALLEREEQAAAQAAGVADSAGETPAEGPEEAEEPAPEVEMIDEAAEAEIAAAAEAAAGAEAEKIEEQLTQALTAASAARLGPKVEEPYHRPLGDDGDTPVWTEEVPESQPMPGETAPAPEPAREEDPGNDHEK
jgi:segregation and condensation protein B